MKLVTPEGSGGLSEEQLGGRAATMTGAPEDQPGESENMGSWLGLAPLPSSTPWCSSGLHAAAKWLAESG